MSTFVPKDVQAGLDSARNKALKSASRLRLKASGHTYPILRMWKSGFAVEADTVPYLRGYVDMYDGAIHLFQCLIVAADEDGGQMRYEFKRLTAVSSGPARDFVVSETAPVALIGHSAD